MEILLWLVPPALVTVLAMIWAGWRGRVPRQESRDEAVRRLGEALAPSAPGTGRFGGLRVSRRGVRPGYRVPAVTPDPSTGVAVRPSRRPAE